MTDEVKEDAAPAATPLAEAEAPGAAPSSDGTLLSKAGGDDTPVAAPADWPEDWRAKFAGDDEKALKKLERYKSPKDIFAAYRALESKMSSGEVKQVLGKDATPEQIAEYRKANGIPEKADGYLESLPNGLVIGEDDKPLVQSFLDKVHGKNASPEIVSEALAWYYDAQEQMSAAQVEADKKAQAAAADELRAEWGNEYRANFNSAMNFLETAPEGVKEEILKGRGASGVALGDNPAVLKWLVHLANEANPAGFIAPASGQSQLGGIEEQIAEIQQLMRDDPKKYYAGDYNKKYEKLIAAREKMNSRVA